MSDPIGSSDERALADLKAHPESAAAVLEGDAEGAAKRVESLYTRVWGALKADWAWIASELHRHHAPADAPAAETPVTSETAQGEKSPEPAPDPHTPAP